MPVDGTVPRPVASGGFTALAIAPETGARTPMAPCGPGTLPPRTPVRRTDTMPPFVTIGSVTGRTVLSDRPGSVPLPSAMVLRCAPVPDAFSVDTPMPVSDAWARARFVNWRLMRVKVFMIFALAEPATKSVRTPNRIAFRFIEFSCCGWCGSARRAPPILKQTTCR